MRDNIVPVEGWLNVPYSLHAHFASLGPKVAESSITLPVTEVASIGLRILCSMLAGRSGSLRRR